MIETVELSTRVSGSGEPLVIAHGLFGSSRNWSALAQSLSEHYQVWCVDLRNHGESPHAETMGYPEMAADLLALLDREGLERIHLIGHSMGGKTAMWFALHHPRRVKRLMVVDIAPVSYPHDYVGMVAAMRGIDFSLLGRRDQVDAALRAVVAEPGVRQFLLTNLVNREGQLQWRVNLAAIGAGLPALTAFPELTAGLCYDGPTLFLGGANSPYLRSEHEPRIFRLFPNAEIVHLPATGHWVHAERPGEFLRTAQRFFAGEACS